METENEFSPVEMVLTCGSWQEAQRIVDSLLEQKLVACAEFFEVKSKFQWKGGLHEDTEIRLIMESAEHLFEAVEQEVRKLHSYETFVLQATPITRISHDANAWINEVLGKTQN